MKDVNESLVRLIDIFDYLVDDHVGIVHHVEEVPRVAGAPDLFHFVSRACNTRAFSQQANFANAGGASSDRSRAAAKAIGEAVERYCAALFDVEELPLTAYRSAPFPCVSPNELALFAPHQYEQTGFPWSPFCEITTVRWTPAIDPVADEVCYLPAAMVFVPYHYYRGTRDTPIVQPISTGLACHCSPAEAAISAINEVIERDAFVLTWQACLAPPQLRIETLSDTNYEIVQRFEQTGSAVTLLTITTDIGVPTILAILRSESPAAPALVLAAAADLDPEQAVRKSLEELAHTTRYSQQIKSHLPRLAPDPHYTNVVDQVSHLNFWSDHANAPLARFIFASQDRVEFDAIESLATGHPQRDLETLCAKVRAIGHRVLLADLTTQDVRSLGLTVVRAVIPGFHPLFMGHRIRALGGDRLWEVPQKLGYQGITRESGDNPVPHPYP
jgi:ribosomal protein S12 methylthiotransferase accessory factor